jgi:hypothetical protein
MGHSSKILLYAIYALLITLEEHHAQLEEDGFIFSPKSTGSTASREELKQLLQYTVSKSQIMA